jgi:hypothetical protein
LLCFILRTSLTQLCIVLRHLHGWSCLFCHRTCHPISTASSWVSRCLKASGMATLCLCEFCPSVMKHHSDVEPSNSLLGLSSVSSSSPLLERHICLPSFNSNISYRILLRKVPVSSWAVYDRHDPAHRQPNHVYGGTHVLAHGDCSSAARM